MLIGYSFWGFLGPGIIDTPDGGRSHRRTLIDGLQRRGHEVVFLQRDRDRTEAGLDLADLYRWEPGLPVIDVLMLEWRWPIAGRNTTPCGTASHTCDLHRQAELVTHYTDRLGTPTLLWDKDRQLPADDSLWTRPNVTICEPALHPRPRAVSLLFPLADAVLRTADPAALAALPRPLPLVYIGNQYDRDDAFERFFAPAAGNLPHAVAGKWSRTSQWPHVNFVGRIAFEQVAELYREALATVLLLPERYRSAGQMTQRIFEAVLAGCLPLAPTDIDDVDAFVPRCLQVVDGAETLSKIDWLTAVTRTTEHTDLISQCLGKLDLFRLSAQLDTIDRVLSSARGVDR
ncbi:hypothetical protein I6A84_20885 [Frankia sp. CNm7]|nr:hypothetical protein [Frankia nepalensis]MBL7510267.1 hypothetical protein [Frankia nepalensis]MBL7520477.1 hypothetical protein [Frankia nepalensis]